MSEANILKISAKDTTGKGVARKIRQNGMIPGVIYGKGFEDKMFTVDPRDVWKGLYRTDFFSVVMKADIDGQVIDVLPRAVQFDRVTDQPIHLDLMAVQPESKVKVRVPVIFENEADSPGLKRGAVLNAVRRMVEVQCMAKDIPSHFTSDLTGLQVNDSVKFSDLTIPDNVTPTIRDRDFVIATITAPSALKRQQMQEAKEAAQAAG